MSAAVQGILDGLASATASRVLTLPVPAGSGLPADLAARLQQVAGVLGRGGSLDVVGATITSTAAGITVHGRIAALGLDEVDLDLSLGPGDALTASVSLAASAPSELGPSLSWSSLSLGVSAPAGAVAVAGTFAGVLSVAGRRLALSLTRFDSGPPATWTLAIGGGQGVAPTDLPGVAALVALLPGVATIASGSSPELVLVTSGDDPRLAFDVPLAASLTVWPSVVAVTTTALTPMVRFGVDPGEPAIVAFEVAGALTVAGTTQAGSVRITPAKDGVELRVVVEGGSSSLLTVDGLAQAFLGKTASSMVADVPAGLGARLASSGFSDLSVIIGPAPATIAFEGAGTFLGWPAWGRLEAKPWLGGTAVGVWLRLREQPATLGAIVNALGLQLPGIVNQHLPAVALALRELRYDPTEPSLRVGGAITSAGWELDLSVDLGAEGGVHFEAGTLYEADGRLPPSLTQLLDALLVGSPHTALLTTLDALVPAALSSLIATASVQHAAVSWFPASSTGGTPASLSVDLVVALNAGSGPLVATLDIVTSGPDWRVGISTPGLVADVVEIATMLGLPTGGLRFSRGQLEVSCDHVDIGSKGIDLSFELDVDDVPATLTAQVRRDGTAWTWELGLGVGPLVFDLDVDTGPPVKLQASLVAAGGDGVRVSEVAELLGVRGIPEEVDLGLDEVHLHFVPSVSGVGLTAKIELARPQATLDAALATTVLARTPPVRAWALHTEFPSAHLGLDGIPVLGRLVPDASTFGIDIDQLAVGYANLDLTSIEVDQLNALVTGTPVAPSASVLAQGLSLHGRLRVAGTAVPIAPAPVQPTPAPPAGGGVVPAGPATPQTGQLTWKTVGASLGPVHVAAVGIGYADGRILVGVTGSLNLSVLELTLVGLRIGVPIAALTDPGRLRDITFGLDGAGIQLNPPGVSLGGSLVQRGDRLDGVAVLSASGTSISLLASLTRTEQGAPSVFLYGVLNREIGGPAFLFVTGLAAGFGYNRGLVAPSVEAVPDFPLVKSALGHGAKPSSVDELVDMLARPETAGAFPPEDGSMFLAAGIRFTSFKVVESFVMLAVALETGHTTILLLGTSRLQLPPELPATTPPVPPVPPLAVIELALKATYEVERGRLEVRGLLVGSYILSHACALTGGFAVIAQFKDDTATGVQAGEFVVTVGGFHPDFVPPRWYPSVPRLGLTWRVSDDLYVKGSAYFAITPHTAMAGGSLDACWEKGGLSARFTMAADFLVQWQPYHYKTSFSIGVRGGLRWGLIDISISVHAEVEVYGPPFGGKATLDLGIVSKTVEFGAGEPPRVPLPAADFPASFLPGHAEVCGSSLRAGALAQDAASGTWSVAPGAVEIAIHTAVPATAASVGVPALAALDAGGAAVGALSIDHPGAPIAGQVLLAPCETVGTAPLAFAVVAHRDGQEFDATHLFLVTPTFKELPTALWNLAGAPAAQPATGAAAPQEPRTATALAGFLLATRPSTAAPATSLLPLAALESAPLNGSDEVAGLPLRVTLRGLGDATAPASRADVLGALGLDPASEAPAVRPALATSVPSLAASS